MYTVNRIFREKEGGFTFIEALFQLIVFTIFAQIIVLVFMWFNQFQTIDKMKDHINWELFVFDINNYLLNASEFSVYPSGVGFIVKASLYGEEKEYIIGKSSSYIRKTVATSGGYELMLVDVKNANFSLNGDKMILRVTMENGIERERTFIVPYISK